jgi:hypothetical protein
MGHLNSDAHCHYSTLKALGVAPSAKARAMRLNTVRPDKWALALPLVRKVDELYAALQPDKHSSRQ